MRKIFNDIISFGFIALMVLVLISGLSVLLGFENPVISKVKEIMI
jgi:hypothetical protein